AVVATKLDVRRHGVDNGWYSATGHEVFTGGFQVVVDDLVGTPTVPNPDSLCVCGVSDAGDIGVNDRDVMPIGHDSAAAELRLHIKRMDITAVEGDIRGQVGVTLYPCPPPHPVRVIGASVPHLNDVIYAIDSSRAGNFEF